MTTTEQTKPLHAFRNSGSQARDWKRRIALLAKRGSESMRSLQFPLDIPEDDLKNLPVNKLIVAYNAIEGTGPGTLFHYWSMLHLAGFRFFPQKAGATIFRQQAIFQDAQWNEKFCDQSGKDWPWLKPSSLFERFSKVPRETTKSDGSKKSVDFNAANVANECHVSLIGGSLSEKTKEEVRQFFAELGDALSERFASWKEANADLHAVMKIIDSVTSRYAICPSLAEMALRYGPTKPDSAPIAWAWADVPNVAVTNLAPAIFSRCASLYEKAPDSGINDFVKVHAITPNFTALSWLFGTGWRYFRDTELSEIMSDFEIPAHATDAIRAVKDAALAIPEINLFGKKNYADFRATFGGKIDSWISNYASRLIELQKLLSEIETGFVLPDAVLSNDMLLSGTDMCADELKELISNIYDSASQATFAVNILLGQEEGDIDAAIAQFERFSSLLDSLHGALNTIKAKLDTSFEIAGSDEDEIEKLLPCKFEIPKWCTSLPKLVGISGGAPNVEAEIAAIQTAFNDVRTKMQARYDAILSHVDSLGKTADPYKLIEERELDTIRRISPHAVPPRAHVQAYRNVLHRIGRAVQNCSEDTRQQFASMVKETGLFENFRHFNTFLFNQKGAIYLSPFAKARNKQYRVKANILLANDWLAMCKELGEQLWQSGKISCMEDALRLQRTVMQITLSGLPRIEYPSSLALPDIEVAVHPVMQMQLNKPTVTVDVLQKAFNLYTSVLGGLSFKLLRARFTVKMRFSLSEPTQLIYAPKDRHWSIPKQYLQSDGALGSAARTVLESLPDGGTPAQMLEALDKSPEDMRGEFMRQSPHDWYFDLGLSSGIPTAGYIVEKGKSFRKIKKTLPGYRIIGSPSYKTVLDKSLVGLSEIKQASILFELNYTQSVFVQDNEFQVATSMKLPRVVVTLPVNETITATEKDESLLFDRFVAIDLGEMGIGYAVFDAKTGDKIASGHRKVPDIRNLVRRTQHYENKPNQRQKFQQKFNINMSELRENVAGNVCHQINRICAYYKAFPVLEYMAGGKLNPQIKSVYETVTNRYVWSSTAAHKGERQQFWLGGEIWEHPFLKNAKDKKPLVLSPGRGISGKGTSQRCSCCGENPVDLLRNLKSGSKLAVLNGKVTVEGKTMKLFERTIETDEEFRKRKRANKRPTMRTPLSSGNYKVEDLISVVNRNLRQGPEDRRTQDTSVSQYHCVFENCGVVMHADENAGINIGEKFLDEVLIPENISV